MMCNTDSLSYVLLPGSEIPNWISHQAMGSSVSFRVPSYMDGRKIGKVLLCNVYAVNKEAPALGGVSLFIWRLCNKSSRDQYNYRNYTGGCMAINQAPNFDIFEDHIQAKVMEWDEIKMKSGDEIEVATDLQHSHGGEEGIDRQIVEVKRSGIHFVLDDGDEPSVRDDDEICESESEEDRRL
jgi:hypothetical protein